MSRLFRYTYSDHVKN
uniref:Uncharacterized protein n=1 Tax=Anguilla anguilla TaxID=7936 RepID=A0A0E9S0X1_ANGAN